ncbi:hypothetical protein BG023_11677 [Porphyrobacter sp. LM 6]|nr:hypothetical protein BG023_11677 [Porphyrobacter sp. LM 6]
MRVFGTVPEDYSGTVWYRTANHHITRPTVHGRFQVEKCALEEEFWHLTMSGQTRGRKILTPGLIVDEAGALLPKWRVPRKARVVGKGPLPEVNGGGLSGLVSERVHAVIIALEPRAHVFLPFDVEHSDGRIERFYAHNFADSYLGSDFIRPECLFSLAKHQIETGTNSKGITYFKDPEFMRLGGTCSNDFFFLNERVVDGRHLFTSDFGGGGVTFFSPTLMERLAPFGDIFTSQVDCVRIGVAPPGPALPPPVSAKEKSVLGKLRTIFGGS